MYNIYIYINIYIIITVFPGGSAVKYLSAKEMQETQV